MRALVATVFCCSIGTNAFSQVVKTSIIGGGVLYAGRSAQVNGAAVCYMFNIGITTGVSATIFDELGKPQPLYADTCTAKKVMPFSSCVIASYIENYLGYSCYLNASPPHGSPGANIRGTLEIRDASGNVLVTSPLQ
jgi:hypothetical protein